MSKLHIQSHFGTDVLSLSAMKQNLSNSTMSRMEKTIHQDEPLDRAIAEEVAKVMLDWAVEKGATHYTHWFQPLTGTTAEKHESFLNLNVDLDAHSEASMNFSAKELIIGEPDASSFPSGGLRATFEARGYTAWDPKSPAFIIRGKKRATLCIPSIFLGYHGEALDKKTPLLRSIKTLTKQIQRISKLFGDSQENTRKPYVTLGVEQEYFLVDKKYYCRRPDLIETGRTLFGTMPAKHQQQEDHYFGSIKSRVIAFMEGLDEELWALGIPAKTRHNEVAPGQYELAPSFEEMNLAIDHNMLMMDVMRRVADRHDLAVLLHEKPFTGINGSGKHNNWAITGPDGKNWFHPGKTSNENAKFITMICAVIKGVDMHEDLLRLSIASSGNDRRLGGNEAPPSIISIFLGDQLYRIIEQVEMGKEILEESKEFLEVSVTSMPNLERDNTDRNRTSPLAFTGSKFEFRALGSSINPAGPNIILNTIVADALDAICGELEKKQKDGNSDFKKNLQEVLAQVIKDHKRILFNGNNYSSEWVVEAKKRKLSNYQNTAQVLQVLKEKKNIELFEKYKVLSQREQQSRYEIYLDRYFEEVNIERKCAIKIARTMILPTAIRWLKDLRFSQSSAQKRLVTQVSEAIDQVLEITHRLEGLDVQKDLDAVHTEMQKLRKHVDALEEITPRQDWPLPSYLRMLHLSL